jgi:hypothetical protein
VEEQAHEGADDRCAEAGGGRPKGRVKVTSIGQPIGFHLQYKEVVGSSCGPDGKSSHLVNYSVLFLSERDVVPKRIGTRAGSDDSR